MVLTDEQRATIERNKAEALKRAAARKAREAAAELQRKPHLVKPLLSTTNFSRRPTSGSLYTNRSTVSATHPTKLSSTTNASSTNASQNFQGNEKPPPHIQQILREPLAAPLRGIIPAAVEPSISNLLFPYQRAGVEFGVQKNGRVLVADEMGLGKSVQALAIARCYKSEWPLLVVCPASVKAAWKSQFESFLPTVTNVCVMAKSMDPWPEEKNSNTVVIMSYDQMILRDEQLKSEKIKVVIFDESHMLKDSKAKRTRVATDLSRIALRVILLSGTPALSCPAELFTQLRMIDPFVFPNYRDFAMRYCNGREGRVVSADRESYHFE
ncbi:unnamed protein product [Caenorhabditis auriculariae]|uniref:Helicase ATP-binding domain-containing protein n=1 Tax=Caenorhabditis auriculariae TaxID=2777116 RepID=A0A8S1HZG3_9PELO|nr:unnamed protein product [Caenorhabditis auriculariae]